MAEAAADHVDFDGVHLLTVGHSNRSTGMVIEWLKRSGATAVADVRSSPYSKANPQFERASIKQALKQQEIAFVFLGNELGGRPRDLKCYDGGVADYEIMATKQPFVQGLERLRSGATKFKVALMCSEAAPLECHRTLLVARAVVERGGEVEHIDEGGTAVSHRQIEEELLGMRGKLHDDMFLPRGERLAQAYKEQAMRVAYRLPRLTLETAEQDF